MEGIIKKDVRGTRVKEENYPGYPAGDGPGEYHSYYDARCPFCEKLNRFRSSSFEDREEGNISFEFSCKHLNKKNTEEMSDTVFCFEYNFKTEEHRIKLLTTKLKNMERTFLFLSVLEALKKGGIKDGQL